MWIRGIIGALLCLAGIVWILQGVNVLHGSMMSGRGGYAVLGAAVLVLGLFLLGWAWRQRGSRG
ncbi:MAG: hypothetical protein WCF63_09620 [Acidimicrobiales bacterium]